MSLDKPRFRRDLEVRPVLSDGQSHVEVRDVAAGTTFLFYDFEYQVALAFDGLPLEKVIPWVKLATGLALQVEQLEEFARRLDELGFLEGEPAVEGTTLSGGELAEPTPEPMPEPPPLPSTTPSEESQPSVPDQASAQVLAVAQHQTAEQGDFSGPEQPPGEGELPGPPEPDSVVMHPSEVVGETPPPVWVGSVRAPEAQAAQTDEKTGADDEHAAVEETARDDRPVGEAKPDAEAVEQAAGGTREAVAGVDATISPAGHAADDMAVASAASDAEQADSSLLGDERERIAEATRREGSPPDPGVSHSSDSPAFPVLPVSRPATPDAPPVVAPPPWTTPRPVMTPVPVTFGPSMISDQPSARRRIRRSFVVFGTLGVLAAVALLVVTLPFVFSSRQPPPIVVRTLTASPGTVYRYFDGAAPIVEMPGPVLKFPAGGKVIRMVGKGSAVAVGDVVAAVELARPLQNQLVRQRERLAYYQQMAEAMHQVGNSKEEERQLATVEARSAAIAKTLRALANLAVVATGAGEVEEAFAHEGEAVEAESPAVRLRSPGFRVTFELSRSEAASARRLAFCQVEVEGYLLDCNPAQTPGDESHVAVDLSQVPPALVGKPAHLARARYTGAVVLPVAALQVSGSRVGVFVVSKNARLETRQVAVEDRDDVEVIVVQGLDGGDRVVVEPSLGLQSGMLVGTSNGG